MKLSRRKLIRTSGAITVGLGLAGTTILGALASPKPKSILIFGGTGFIGPNTVRYAVERGHKVSIFTRGRKQADLPECVERLVGDRNNDHSALEGREWDAVLDNNCYDYRWVQKSTELLRDATEHYLFVSSLSSYAMPDMDFGEANVPLAKALPLSAATTPIPADWSDGDEADYALMKVLSENIVMKAFPGRSTIIRPTLIVGPGDQTGRWSYWPVRFQDGGEILAPGNPAHSTQIIDQRDLTQWHVRLIENGTTGIFNGAGPANYLTMESMLKQVGQSVGDQWSLTWVDEAFLATHKVSPWGDMPAWVPGYPMMYVDVSASVDAGLRFRPISETARDTLAFENSRDLSDDSGKPFSFTRERESKVLKAWNTRQV